MRVISIASPSHAELRDGWFLKTLPNAFTPHVIEVPQRTATGTFYEDGWTETVTQKFDAIAQVLDAHPGESAFLFSDIDVQFFDVEPRDVLRALRGVDIAFQRDDALGTVCTGLIAFRPTAGVRSLFERVRRTLKAGWSRGDQHAINTIFRHPWAGTRPFVKQRRYARTKTPTLRDRLGLRPPRWQIPVHDVRWTYLPHGFFGPGPQLGSPWTPETPLVLPQPLRAHHANWVQGIPLKLAQLKAVRDAWESH